MDRLSSPPECPRYFPLLQGIALHPKFYQSECHIIFCLFLFILLGFLLGFLSPHSSQLHNMLLYPAYISSTHVRTETFALRQTRAVLFSICATKYSPSLCR